MSGFFFRPSPSGAAVADAISRTGAPVYGRTPANLRRWQVALARMRAASGRPRLVMIGTSKTVGAGAGSGPPSGFVHTAGAEPWSKPARLAAEFSARGLSAGRNAWFGTKGAPSPSAFRDYDPRVTGLSASWGGGASTLGGVCWAAGADADDLVFTPEGPVDTCEVFYAKSPGDGQGRLALDASPTAVVSFDGNAPQAIGKAVATFPLGPHALRLTRVSGGYLSLIGAVAYDSTSPAVDVINAGAFGTVSAFHTAAESGSYAAENVLGPLAPDLVAIELGTNDLNAGVPVASYAANIRSIVAKAKAAGADVVLEVATFGAPGGYGTDAEREAYRRALLAIGTEAGCMVVDHAARFGRYAGAHALGLMRDAVHETRIGHADVATALAAALID